MTRPTNEPVSRELPSRANCCSITAPVRHTQATTDTCAVTRIRDRCSTTRGTPTPSRPCSRTPGSPIACDRSTTAVTRRSRTRRRRGVHRLPIQARAGHADFSTTQRYIILAGVVFRDEAVRAEARILGPWVPDSGTDSGATFLSRGGNRRVAGTYPAGATGLEPATPGFGDRCATSCATPLGCGRSVPGSCLVALCGEDAAVRARGAVHGDRGVARAPRAVVGPLRRARVGRRVRGGSRRPLDGGSRTTGLAKPIGPIWPSRQDETADARRILLGWVRRPSDRVTPNPDERALGGHADAVAGLSRHA